MKLNKRVLASATLSVSLVVPAVAPVASATDTHVNCEQNFRAGRDFDGDANGKVAEHLQRNCNLSAEQISKLSLDELKSVAKELKKADGTPAIGVEEIEQLTTGQVNSEAENNKAADEADEPGETQGNGAGGEQQSVDTLTVNAVKAGAKSVTGWVFLLPGQKKTINVTFPNFRTETTQVQLEDKSGEEGKPSVAGYAPFEVAVPEGTQLEAGQNLFVAPAKDPSKPDVKVVSTKVVVEPADVVEGGGQGSEGSEGSDQSGAGSEGSESPEGPDSGDSVDEFPVDVIAEVNDIKEGDKKVTGKLRLFPGQKEEIEAYFPGGGHQSTVVELPKDPAKKGQASESQLVSFDIDIPENVQLKAGQKVTVSPVPTVTDPETGKSNSVEVVVKAADKGSESRPEQTPDNGKGQTPGNDGSEKPGKPQGPGNGGSEKPGNPEGPGNGGSEKPGKPSVPGNGSGGSSSNFGAGFGVISGVVAFVAGVVKFFNQFSGIARFLQPLRNFFSLFKF